MSQPHDPGHPIPEEVDDSQNPTTVAPAEGGAAERGDVPHGQERPEDAGSPRQREMLHQLQDMIDAVAREARPVMREVVAKSAELAAIAAERAGPLAAKAAVKTQEYGERIATRSKEMAADLRRQGEDSAEPAGSAESVEEGPR